MFVYVLSKDGQPLMPTKRFGKVRRMLNKGLAKVADRCPFTIQLLYETETKETQPVEVGDDTGSKHNGLSAVVLYKTGRTVEVYASEVQMRTDITKLLSARRELRKSRRNRTTRYRKPRFDNRVHSKHKGWLAPSVENKILTHERELLYICSILPVTKVTVEIASFDLQKLKADMEGLKRPQGKEYQKGEQMGFWNAREFVLFRDGHTCQCCKGKSGDKRLNVHHIESRQTGGNAPNNLITLCETCHDSYHKGKVKLPDTVKRKRPLRDATFMGIMRWAFYNRIKETLTASIEVCKTYGYLTKNTRIENKLPKTHCVDARCIAGYPNAEPLDCYYYKTKVRCHNRQLHKTNYSKGGVRKANQAPKEVKGFRLFDRVMFEGKECFIFGRRSTGYFDLRTLDGTKVHASASYKKLRLLERAGTVLTERRVQEPHDKRHSSPACRGGGYPA